MKCLQSLCQAICVASHMNGENHASIVLTRPGQESFVVSPDESDCAVYHVRIPCLQRRPGLIEKIRQPSPRNIDLCKCIRAGMRGMDALINRMMIVTRIWAVLMRVGPDDSS